MGVFGIRYFDESAPDSSGAVSYGAMSGHLVGAEHTGFTPGLEGGEDNGFVVLALVEESADKVDDMLGQLHSC